MVCCPDDYRDGASCHTYAKINCHYIRQYFDANIGIIYVSGKKKVLNVEFSDIFLMHFPTQKKKSISLPQSLTMAEALKY